MQTEIHPRASVYLPESAVLLEAFEMTEMERFFRFRVKSGRALDYKPGQFFEISVPGIGEAPISITSAPNGDDAASFEMVIRKVGNVTKALHALEVGSHVGIRGPFGTSFPVENAMPGRDLLFICGGIGLVPVRSAIDYVFANTERYGRVTILLGTRTPKDRLFVEQIFAWKQLENVTVLETVDVADAYWGGSVGVITTLIPRAHVDSENTVAIVCGPPIMYKFVIKQLKALNLPDEHIYMSLERHMKCGVGKCGHCQINGAYACQDGPVFRYADLHNLPEAL